MRFSLRAALFVVTIVASFFAGYGVARRAYERQMMALSATYVRTQEEVWSLRLEVEELHDNLESLTKDNEVLQNAFDALHSKVHKDDGKR